MLPLNGCRSSGSWASGTGRSRASAPDASMLARVVSKWVLPSTTWWGWSNAWQRSRSEARPWWVGITWVWPKTPFTAASKWK